MVPLFFYTTCRLLWRCKAFASQIQIGLAVEYPLAYAALELTQKTCFLDRDRVLWGLWGPPLGLLYRLANLILIFIHFFWGKL